MVEEAPQAESVPTTRKRILLVDDDREIIESMRMALEAAGCDEYFTKPLPMRALGDRLRDFLREREKTESREYASTS
jgi:DNA-binding response OmpR family regulator